MLIFFIYPVHKIHSDVTIFMLKTYVDIIAGASHKFIGDFTMGKSCWCFQEPILEFWFWARDFFTFKNIWGKYKTYEYMSLFKYFWAQVMNTKCTNKIIFGTWLEIFQNFTNLWIKLMWLKNLCYIFFY